MDGVLIFCTLNLIMGSVGYRSLHDQYPNWIFYFVTLTKYLNRASISDESRPTAFSESTKNTPYFLCSRQESNLHRQLRRPAFYPLNYGSMFFTSLYQIYSITKQQKNHLSMIFLRLLNTLFCSLDHCTDSRLFS